MKKFWKHSQLILSICLLAVFFIGCRNDDGSGNVDIFVGVYKGEVNYTDGQNPISNLNGSVEVVKIEDTYVLEFSDGIPTLDSLEYLNLGDVLTNVEADETHLVRITESTLQVIYTTEDNQQVWTAVCFKD